MWYNEKQSEIRQRDCNGSDIFSEKERASKENMIGVLVNTAAVFIAALIGLAAGKGIPERLTTTIFQALALFVMYVGITGALGGKNTIVILLSLALGALLGELIDLDKGLKKFGEFIENKFVRKGLKKFGEFIENKFVRKKEKGDGPVVEEKVSFSEAFVTTSLLMCVGAYILVGGMKAGLEGDNSMLYSKAALDGISAIVLAASMGAGVVLASVSIFVVTGAIVLLAQLLEPLLSQAVIADMVSVGSLIIIAQALNMLKVTNVKIMNLTPAMFLPIGLVPLYGWVVSLV